MSLFKVDSLKNLLLAIAGTYLAYRTLKKIYALYKRDDDHLFVPIGKVKQLFIYPIKACKGTEVFSFKCTPLGPKAGEMVDRHFLVVDNSTGKFYTDRQKPELILIHPKIENGILTLRFPDGNFIDVDLKEVKKCNDVRPAILHHNKRTDGLDCGDDVAKVLSEYIKEPDTRLHMFKHGLYTERYFESEDSYWNSNPVPKRKDDIPYYDFSPYLVTTMGSLDELNKRLEEPVSIRNFRPVIVVEGCPAWDEDKWAELRIGEAKLICYRPCTRCTVTTVNPDTGVMNKNNQPLRTLREFRLAPEGKMRDRFKDSPVFGVQTGLNHEGYIHTGQTVYARYKPSAF